MALLRPLEADVPDLIADADTDIGDESCVSVAVEERSTRAHSEFSSTPDQDNGIVQCQGLRRSAFEQQLNLRDLAASGHTSALLGIVAVWLFRPDKSWSVVTSRSHPVSNEDIEALAEALMWVEIEYAVSDTVTPWTDAPSQPVLITDDMLAHIGAQFVDAWNEL